MKPTIQVKRWVRTPDGAEVEISETVLVENLVIEYHGVHFFFEPAKPEFIDAECQPVESRPERLLEEKPRR